MTFPEQWLDKEPFSAEQETASNGFRTRMLILGAVLALALGYMIYAAFPGNALYFLSVGEFMEKEDAKDGRMVRVSGKLVDDSFRREGNSTLSRFQLTDKVNGNESGDLAATYTGVLPDLFFNSHSEIILQGRYGPNRVFEADTILVKCPSKYQSLEDELKDSNEVTGSPSAQIEPGEYEDGTNISASSRSA